MRHKKAVIDLLRVLVIEANQNLANAVLHEDWYGEGNWREMIRDIKKVQKLVNEEDGNCQKKGN